MTLLKGEAAVRGAALPGNSGRADSRGLGGCSRPRGGVTARDEVNITTEFLLSQRIA